MPVTGGLFLLAMLAIMGLPPFGLFVSEVLIFSAGFQSGHWAIAATGLLLLVGAFAGLLRSTHRMLYGAAAPTVVDGPGLRSSVPAGVALLLLTLTGMAWPPGLAAALDHIARLLGPCCAPLPPVASSARSTICSDSSPWATRTCGAWPSTSSGRTATFPFAATWRPGGTSPTPGSRFPSEASTATVCSRSPWVPCTP